ncbi:hypothetical protein KZ829_04985 [Actinoplanes hulinensis]|uniref:PKD domain-containing protein n=1 Tax=Actinoplanes hulinensis TaxID=1144547 RepID=A0ABS7AWH6_9ACTN|nr:hypothetical protein [Actinoplanes hulinensis]MBW6433098.1 hypothetical protein [Actinoplanes hulinensis]
MKSRHTRPLVAAIVSGVLVAGGVVVTSPASAVGPATTVVNLADESTDPTVDPTTDPTTEPTTDPTTDPTTTAPTTEPTTTPPTTDPTTTPPTTEPTTTPPTTGPTTTPPTTGPTGDTAAPTGSFRVNATSLWLGQSVQLSQAAADFQDDTDTDAQITRVVNWGDGSAPQTLAAGAVGATRQYSRVASFTITVTMTDRAGNARTLTRTVAVTNPAGKYSLSRAGVYQGYPFAVKISGLPAGTRYMSIDWGNNYRSGLSPKTGTYNTSLLYDWDAASRQWNLSRKITGARTLKIAFWNANGWSAYRAIGTVQVYADAVKPSLSITKPSKSNRVSSWKTVRGTASDKASGVTHVWMTVARSTASGKLYCLTPQRKWKRFYTDAQFQAYCSNSGVRVTVSKGRWSLRLPAGVSRGQFLVYAWTFDRAGNLTERARQVTLNKA